MTRHKALYCFVLYSTVWRCLAKCIALTVIICRCDLPSPHDARCSATARQLLDCAAFETGFRKSTAGCHSVAKLVCLSTIFIILCLLPLALSLLSAGRVIPLKLDLYIRPLPAVARPGHIQSHPNSFCVSITVIGHRPPPRLFVSFVYAVRHVHVSYVLSHMTRRCLCHLCPPRLSVLHVYMFERDIILHPSGIVCSGHPLE